MNDDKITLDAIRRQRQVVADLKYKADIANKEYWRLVNLKDEAYKLKNQTETEHENEVYKLRELGKEFAMDLSETTYTPQIEVQQ